MKQITVYGLLGKIKNGNIPNKIRFDGNVYEYHDKEHGYCRHAYDNTYVCLNSEYYLFDILNDEAEIIDDEIETISNKTRYYFSSISNGMMRTDREALDSMFDTIYKKIDELSSAINEMKKGK